MPLLPPPLLLSPATAPASRTRLRARAAALLVAVAWGLAPCSVLAQAAPAAAASAPKAATPAATSNVASAAALAAPLAQGRTLEGEAFTLRASDARVRVLMFWRTDCPVCLSKMPELRANAAGWRSRPFDLVLLNADTRRGEALAYDELRRSVGGNAAPLLSAWLGEVRLPPAWQPGTPLPRLPLMLVIDPQGRVVARHEGRVPPELWDDVAALLP